MNWVNIRQVTVQADPEEAHRAVRVARRAAELLGEQLCMGDVVQPQGKLAVDIRPQAMWSDEQLAQVIARELRSRLG